MDNTTKKTLMESGFREKELEIYLAILELEKSTILQIAEKSGVKRPTVYEILPILVRKGYVVEETSENKTLYIAKNPEYVLALLQKKADLFKKAMPDLMAIFNAPENKPKVRFYQGKEEVQKMYEDTLEAGVPLLNLTSLLNLYKYLDREWVDRYIKRRVELGISTKIIAVDSPEAREWADSANSELRKIKLIENSDYNFSADMHIYGNKIIITTYKEDLFGLIIEDDFIAGMQRMAFGIMWSSLTK